MILLAGSPSENSKSTAALDAIGCTLRQRGLRTLAVRVRDMPANDLMHGQYASPMIQGAAFAIGQARAVVVSTPVYKAAYSGVLKAFLDLLPRDLLAGKFVLPVATGGSVGHLLMIDYALKPVLHALGARHILPGVFLQDGQFQSTPNGAWSIVDQAGSRLSTAVDELTDELVRTTNAR